MKKEYPPTVGIAITTLNRSDFLIRQLNYYANNHCHHAIYIADTSTINEHIEKTKETITRLQNRMDIVYNQFLNCPPAEATYKNLCLVKEKYACFNGDDDYQIPNSLTKCVEFLETHPDYATATGYVVNFRLKQEGVYGNISVLKDYPRPEIHKETASQRIIDFLDQYFVTNISVSRIEQMKINWSNHSKMPDLAFGSEILPGVLSIIDGKAKTLDCLSIVRQMHNRQYALSFILDWVTHPEWLNSYLGFSEIVSKRLSEKDNIPLEKAKQIVKQGFWLYLQKSLIREYPEAFPSAKPKQKENLKKLRGHLTRALPLLKKFYRSYWLPIIYKQKQLHYEVLQPSSSYYKDFKPVMDSFTGLTPFDTY